MTVKVIQWTTGHVGREAVKGILANPALELVGCYAWSKEKVGKDVGALCGLDNTGVLATDDVDALMSLGADCICYMPTFPDPDEMEKLLASGHNLVSSYFINGSSWGPEVQQRLQSAAEKGGVTLFGSGIFPGFANFIAALMASATSSVSKVKFRETANIEFYDAIANYDRCGWGHAPDPKWHGINEQVLGTYSECIDVMADMLHIPIDEKTYDYEAAIAPEDRTYHGFTMPAGTIAGQKCVWRGLVQGQVVVELEVIWNAGTGLEPEWPMQHGYVMDVEGDPNIHTRVKFSPSQQQIDSGTVKDLANPVTAMPVVNAIEAVCRAAPGIKTYADLELIRPRYCGPGSR